MADLPSRLDLYALGRDRVVQTAKKIDPAMCDVAGSDVNLFLGIGSVLAAQVVLQLGFKTAALLLDGADDEDLDRLAYDRYSQTRKGASSARTSVQFKRLAFTAGAGSVPIGTSITTDTGIEYVTTQVANFGPTDLVATTPTNVRAAQAGKATQVGPLALKNLKQPQLLWDPSLTLTQLEAAAGGEEQEDDETFRARLRDFWRTARRGILPAIVSGALTVPGVVSAQAIEATSPTGDPARVVFLYVADSSGVASQALLDDVRVALEDYRAAGIAVLLFNSIPQIANITLKLTFNANVDTVTLTDEIVAAVVGFVNSLPVNGTLNILQLGAVLQRFAADGLVPNLASIVAPVGDLVPGVGQTIRTTAANVTVVR